MGDTDAPQEGTDTDQSVDPDGEPDTTETPQEGDETSGGEQDTETPPEADPQVVSLRREAANYRTKLRAAEADLDAIRTKVGDDPDAALAAAREEGRQEALTEALAQVNDRIVQAEVLAAAARKLADPADAVRLLDLDEFDVSEAGEVDREAIAAAVDGLVKSKPYLAASRAPEFGARPPAPAPEQGMDNWLRRAAGR